MKLSAFINALENGQKLNFSLPNGEFVPAHYHITEIGTVTKDFIDCGGTMRSEKKINFQLWFSSDLDHRLSTDKLLKIVKIGKDKIGLADLEIEVEYQTDTIGKFNVGLQEDHFALLATKTACLAEENCGIPQEKTKLQLADVGTGSSCAPGSGCC